MPIMKNITLRKYYLKDIPHFYSADYDALPVWQKEVIEKEWSELSDETKALFIKTNDTEPYTSQFLLACNALKQLKHTYNTEDNSVTIDRSQELENDNRLLAKFVGYRFHIKETYLEKEYNGELWSYILEIEYDDINSIKKYEEIYNRTNNCKYIFVNNDYLDRKESDSAACINGKNLPVYCCTEDQDFDSCFERYNTVYRGHSHICEKDGKLLYFSLGSDEYAINKDKTAKVNIKTVEYKQNGKNFHIDLSDNADAWQLMKFLIKIAADESVSVIRITTVTEAEITIYGHSRCCFVSVADENGERYAKNEFLSLDRIKKFGLDLPCICVIEMPEFIEDFLRDILCSDFGYIRLSWLYPSDDCMRVRLPELDFTNAEAVILLKAKNKKISVCCTEYKYRLNRCKEQSLDAEKLSAMTAKKMYNLAVKKLETGKLLHLVIGAVHDSENEKHLVIYGDGKVFSVGIIDTVSETTLCYDNSSNDNGYTEFEGQSFTNIMITNDVETLKNIVKCFCETGNME